MVKKGSFLPFAALATKVGSGPFAPCRRILGANFAKVIICALLPLELTAAKARNPPFVTNFCDRSIGDNGLETAV
ncbi:MAG: hypothetical protein COB16_18175 [Rhodobacteraceae bacterium]|nr:MAG: hypothetical protein COB16_18175 [Paracoccaceae bacterium]